LLGSGEKIIENYLGYGERNIYMGVMNIGEIYMGNIERKGERKNLTVSDYLQSG